MIWYVTYGIIIGIIVGALGMAAVLAIAAYKEQKEKEAEMKKNIVSFFEGVEKGLKNDKK